MTTLKSYDQAAGLSGERHGPPGKRGPSDGASRFEAAADNYDEVLRLDQNSTAAWSAKGSASLPLGGLTWHLNHLSGIRPR
jgi:hypothetical protein